MGYPFPFIKRGARCGRALFLSAKGNVRPNTLWGIHSLSLSTLPIAHFLQISDFIE